MELRNKPVDQRRLSHDDRESYRPQAIAQSNARVRAQQAAIAWQANTQPRTQTSTPGSGGFTMGRAAQHMRLREEGAEVARSKELKPDTSVYVNDVYQ